MADVLLYSDTERSAAMRHEVPIGIGDPFGYAEVGGKSIILISSLDQARVAAVRPEAEIIEWADVGFYELLESGMPRDQMLLELISRAVARVGLKDAFVDPDFPLAVADRLRADGVTLTPDHDTFAARRRAKSPAELAGIRRAQKAAEAGMAAAAAVLRAAVPEGDKVVIDGVPVTAEQVRDALRAACAEHGAIAPPDVIVASVWQGFGHEAGSGPLPANLPIHIDLWPRDEESGCWADMARTFVVGEPDARTLELDALAREAHVTARDAIRPGITGRELHALACDIFEATGHKTLRTGPGEDPNEGFQFSLGHGVGLEVHEDPGMGQAGRSPLVAGDVVAIEPGLWDRNVGMLGSEDLVLVTEDGHEILTDYPYDLKP
ncbi:M24 family metallopeptidase [Baekduia sp.]|jgi:Xaa-Pro aminopeptidase|uniref:M24 family metallopeptidase n=1 Tax=Baekduia sp. TaxID=2600305 RepID=UPI002E0AD731|nr:M24 family metallopeptidase [Baekduia sp.]